MSFGMVLREKTKKKQNFVESEYFCKNYSWILFANIYIEQNFHSPLLHWLKSYRCRCTLNSMTLKWPFQLISGQALRCLVELRNGGWRRYPSPIMTSTNGNSQVESRCSVSICMRIRWVCMRDEYIIENIFFILIFNQ